MENNTITPNPEPKPQPVAAMPVFGSAVSAPTVTPEAPPAPTLSTSAMPAMSNQPAAAATPPADAAPAQPLAEPAAPASSQPAAPAAEGLSATMPPAMSTAPAATAPSSTSTTDSTVPSVAATDSLPTSTTPVSTAAPAVDTAGAPAIAPSAADASSPAPADSAPAPTTATTPEPSAVTPASTPTPANKSRLVALIAIIAGLLVAGVIAAVVIVLLNREPSPVAIAEAALDNLANAAAPTSIAADLEAVNSDEDILFSASVVLDNDSLFLSHNGLSDILSGYLGLAAVADQDSISSLLLINSLLRFSENTWWRIPVEDLSLAAEYRAHPFLVLASASTNEYHLKIDGDKFADFLTALGMELDTGEEAANCIDSTGTNCGTSMTSSFTSMFATPTLGQIKQAASSLEIVASIDSQERFTHFYTVIAQNDIVINLNLNLSYSGTSLSPEEYRPIDELMDEFIQAIGY